MYMCTGDKNNYNNALINIDLLVKSVLFLLIAIVLHLQFIFKVITIVVVK